MQHKTPALYYIVRIMQRLSLIATGFFAFLYCGLMTAVALLMPIIQNQVNYEAKNPQGIARTIEAFLDNLGYSAIGAAAVVAILTIALLFFKTERSADRKTIIDSFVITGFCAVAVIFFETAMQMFVTNLAEQGI